MAIFPGVKFKEIEETFLTGKTFGEGDSAFTLSLFRYIPFPETILQYRWKVRLADGYEFEAYMGDKILSPPYTRFNDIQEKIAKHSSALNSEQIAKEIDLRIQATLEDYINSSRL